MGQAKSKQNIEGKSLGIDVENLQYILGNLESKMCVQGVGMIKKDVRRLYVVTFG